MKCFRILPIILVLAILLCAAVPANAVFAEYNDPMDLGSISAGYESNGNPATISGGAGDPGGKSYGAYQFASASNVPYNFAKWCVNMKIDIGTGTGILQAYAADGNTYGDNFDAKWRAIGTNYPVEFLILQHNYTKVQYYDNAAARIQSELGLDVNTRSMALKNAVWSRAVQHGVSGCMTLFRAIAADRTLAALNDMDIIWLLYLESCRVVDAPPKETSKAIHASDMPDTSRQQIVANYGLEGKYLRYYSSCSGPVQVSVFRRLRINELNDLAAMFKNEYPFNDVVFGTWYFPYVKYAVNTGLMKGTSSDTFSPGDPTVRAMVVTILWRLNGTPDSSGGTPFYDIADGSYYCTAANWAYNVGIVLGTSSETFSPERNLTREEMVTLLYRYAGYLGRYVGATADLSTFSDGGSVHGWATAAMQWAVGCGMISGTEKGELMPLANASRAETATMFKRFIEIYNLRAS